MNKVPSKDGTPFAFDRSGRGQAVILTGGVFQYRAITPWTAQLAALLAQHFTVFHYDRRERGGSADTPLYTLEREVEGFDALPTEAGGSAFVFGMSSVRALSLETAAHVLVIKKLTLYEPPFNAGYDTADHAAKHYKKQPTALLAEGQGRYSNGYRCAGI